MLYNEQAASKVAILHNDSTGGGSDMKFQKMLTALVAVLAVLAFAPNALAGGNAIKDNCTPGTCYTVPAIPTTTTSTSSSTSVSIHIKKVWKVTERINQYEKYRNVIVLVNEQAGGVKSQRGCVDPVAKGWIRVGGYYDNSGRNKPGYYTDTWKQGRTICSAKRQKIGNTWYMVGWKDNCVNGIRIRISGPKVFKRYIPVVEVRSFREFTKIYEEWYNKKTSSTGSTTTTTTYSCLQGTLVNVNQCQIHTAAPPPPPGQASVTLVKLVFENGNKVSTQSIFGFTRNGSGFTNSGESTNVGSFQVGTSVTICETNPQGYNVDGSSCQTQTVQQGGITFTFVNRKTTSTPPPPPPVNRPPTGTIKPPQHVYVNGVANVCVDGVTDPDGDQVNVSFSFTAGSAVSAVFTQPSGARCVQYKAPGTPQQVTVTATLSDGRGGTVNLLDNFPVIPDQF